MLCMHHVVRSWQMIRSQVVDMLLGGKNMIFGSCETAVTLNRAATAGCATLYHMCCRSPSKPGHHYSPHFQESERQSGSINQSCSCLARRVHGSNETALLHARVRTEGREEANPGNSTHAVFTHQSRRTHLLSHPVAVLQDTVQFIQDLVWMCIRDMAGRKLYKHHTECVDEVQIQC